MIHTPAGKRKPKKAFGSYGELADGLKANRVEFFYNRHDELWVRFFVKSECVKKLHLQKMPPADFFQDKAVINRKIYAHFAAVSKDGIPVIPTWRNVSEEDAGQLNLPIGSFSGLIEWREDVENLWHRHAIDIPRLRLPDPTDKRTSDKWAVAFGMCITDPDGWDRKNFNESFYKEEITLNEFLTRKRKSSCYHDTTSDSEYQMLELLYWIRDKEKIDFNPETNPRLKARLGGGDNLVLVDHLNINNRTAMATYALFDDQRPGYILSEKVDDDTRAKERRGLVRNPEPLEVANTFSEVKKEFFNKAPTSKYGNGCTGHWTDNPTSGREFNCGYHTTIICDDCKYGGGRKDPEAKCNTEEE